MDNQINKFKAIESRLDHFKVIFLNIKDLFDKSLYKLVILRNDYKMQNEKINDINKENNKLQRRAAVAFDDLTPRPDYKKSFETSGFDFKSIFSESDYVKIIFI